jgi:2-dehydropantoate 2-reductase
VRIAIMGAGGVGGYLGAKLAAGGQDVSFIARGAQLRALRESGLLVSGAQSLHLPRVQATDDPRELGVVDLVLFSVKLYDTDAAAAALAPLLGPNTCVLTVQNGIESAARIARAIGAGRVLAGAAYFPANIAAPGEIAYLGCIAGKPQLAFGEPGAGVSARAGTIAEIFDAAGVSVSVCASTELMLWEKFCLVAATSATTALARQPIGVVREDADLRWMLAEAVAEAARVGRRAGVALPVALEAQVLRAIDGNPPHGKASQLVDLERGRRLELDGLSGAIVRLGREFGEATPVHATVYAALKPYIDGA